MERSMAPVTEQHVTPDGEFDPDVELMEVSDPAGLVNTTDDACGTTCGACTTGAA
jgi:FxLD family lantipeptide